jgi:hypothetical protein
LWVCGLDVLVWGYGVTFVSERLKKLFCEVMDIILELVLEWFKLLHKVHVHAKDTSVSAICWYQVFSITWHTMWNQLPQLSQLTEGSSLVTWESQLTQGKSGPGLLSTSQEIDSSRMTRWLKFLLVYFSSFILYLNLVLRLFTIRLHEYNLEGVYLFGWLNSLGWSNVFSFSGPWGTPKSVSCHWHYYKHRNQRFNN